MKNKDIVNTPECRRCNKVLDFKNHMNRIDTDGWTCPKCSEELGYKYGTFYGTLNKEDKE